VSALGLSTLIFLGLAQWRGPVRMLEAVKPVTGGSLPAAVGSRNFSPASFSPANPNTRAQIEKNYGKLPMRFEANEGQVASQVKFLARGPDYALFLTATEAVLSLKKRAQDRSPTRPSPELPTREELSSEIVRMKIAGAKASPKIVGLEALPGKANYFIGNDPRKWRTDVSTYQKVHYEEVYPGIDLLYYGNQRQLEYDFVVSPHADAGVIQLHFDGARSLRIDEHGDLVFETETGGELRQTRPAIYQDREGTRQTVSGKYILLGSNEVGFEVGSYDRSRPLVIDPTLGYATYLGGTGSDTANGIAVDSSGNAYVVGSTSSTNFPIVNPKQSFSGGNSDVFVAKLNSTGSALTYSTYLGGSQNDSATSVAINSAGNAFVTGYSESSNFPTASPRQASLQGSRDAIVFELGTTGNTLVYSTYHGGSGDEVGAGIAVDSSGNAYVVGSTTSTNFPTASAYQSTYKFVSDAFVTKFNSTGSAMTYSTYLGGTDYDEGDGIAVDSSGNAYVTGTTSSTNFPTVSPRQASSGGFQDVFVTKLNAAGSAPVFSTYHGGNGYDVARGIALDASNNIYITGMTGSTNFPTAGPIQANNAGSNDAFVSKLNSAGSGLVYSTYIGGSGLDSAQGIAVDSSGNAAIAGWSYSTPNFPAVNPLQSIPSENSGGYESFVAKINSAGNGFLYSTYLGGVGSDSALGVATNATATYVVGYADGFPVTAGAFQTTNAGSGDAFIAKIVEGTNPTYYTVAGHLQYASGTPVVGATIQLSGSQTKTTQTSSNGNYVFQLLTAGNYTVTPASSLVTDPAQLTFAPLNDNIPFADFTSNQTVTIGGRVTNVNGRGLSGIRIQILDAFASDLCTGSPLCATDSTGAFSFAVPAGGSYTVGPNDSRVSTWSPHNTITHDNLTQNVTNDNFTAQFPSFTVAGTIKTAGGATVNNLANAVTLGGGASATYPTDSVGKYTSDQLNVLGDYTFTPQPFTVGGITYNTFNPPYLSFMTMTTCNPQTVPPGVLCSGFNYTTVDFIAIPAPSATTSGAISTASTATLNGNANPNGVSTSAWFEWGTDSTLTVSNPTSPSQAIGSGTTNQPISANLTNLTGGTTYYFRAVAMSSGGTVRGAILNFTTTPTPRTLTVASTNPASGVSVILSPNDINGAGNGTTQFTRTYNNNQVVSLTAPATANGNSFQKWLKDGADFANNTVVNVNVTMDANHTMTAVYTTPMTVQFDSASYSAAENIGSKVITVTRTGDVSGPATVDYATSDTAGSINCNVLNTGIASSRCDYETELGTLKFGVGETAKTILVSIVDDAYADGNEIFTITLSNPTGAALGSPNSAQITIIDNETQNGNNPISDARYFVRLHYLDFLNREPDAGGWDFWTNQTTSCGNPDLLVCRINVSASFFLSIEFQQTGYLVERTYKVAYGDADGMSTFPTQHSLKVPIVRFREFLGDTQQITKGVIVLQPGWEQQLENNKVAFFADFVQRTRFINAFPTMMTPTEFVDKLNMNVGNVLSASERTTAINLFGGAGNTTNTTARAQALRQVAEDQDLFNAEFNRAFVLMQYFGYLRRNPNDPQDSDYTGYDFWLTKLIQFGGSYINAEMVKAFITSPEYIARFGP